MVTEELLMKFSTENHELDKLQRKIDNDFTKIVVVTLICALTLVALAFVNLTKVDVLVIAVMSLVYATLSEFIYKKFYLAWKGPDFCNRHSRLRLLLFLFTCVPSILLLSFTCMCAVNEYFYYTGESFTCVCVFVSLVLVFYERKRKSIYHNTLDYIVIDTEYMKTLSEFSI